MFKRNVPTHLISPDNGAIVDSSLFFNMKVYLLIFFDLLPGADGAELFSFLIGFAKVILCHPQVENPNAVHTHEQESVRDQLKEKTQE